MKEKAKSTRDERLNQTIPDVENPDNQSNDNDSGDDGGDNTRDAMSIDQLEAIARSGSVTAVSEKGIIHCLTIIGQIEGHYTLPSQNKTTKYEHVIPQLVAIEEDEEIEGLIIILNTVGGDVEAGLAIAEMIASLSKPTVSLVLGGSHSIGVPIAVSSDYSFIVPTGTMVIHPVRLNGLVIGAQPTYDYFKQMQDRIITFVSKHCNISKKRLETLMMQTGVLTKDVGTILVGKEAVEEGLINEVGGISRAISKLHEMIDKR